MSAPAAFEVTLVAGEPMIRQPVCIEFDDRGRLWVIQYLQYPNPAGLKRARVDRYSRTMYDRVPEPPPHGPKGADRITILEDADGDGRADRTKDFAKDLNLASGLAFGHGGVFVLQVPYLLFYPDRDRDDVPDVEPVVLLSGFGMEDAHSVANSLMWGADGWLYGCQGSTVTANIRGIKFQQGVWRYHPSSRKFELFCEGGGNSWGLDFDSRGNLFYSTNQSPYRMLHAVQGAFYWKSFGKHGALNNPYAYGYFEHVPYENFHGGHVTVGGMIYQGDSFPPQYRGQYVAGDLLNHSVEWHELEALGSSFRAVRGECLVNANDTWFAPSDVTIGPDGAVYVADWSDQRTAHPDPDAEWDRSNGRVYRVQAKGAKRVEVTDLARLSSHELVDLITSSNEWLARKARRMLADRRDSTVVARLRAMTLEGKLPALWALYVSGGFDDSFAMEALAHSDSDIRRWTIRFLGDEEKVSPAISKRLAEMAAADPDVNVRSQLASTARRLSAADGLPIVRAILRRDQDASDPHIPLLLWWAVEKHAIAAREQVLALFDTEAMWNSKVADPVLRRVMRRYAAEGNEPGLDSCARLLYAAPSERAKRHMLASLELGLSERTSSAASAKLTAELEQLWVNDTVETAFVRAAVRLGGSRARLRAEALATDNSQPIERRVAMIGVLGSEASATTLLKLLDGPAAEAVQIAAVNAMRSFDSGDAILPRLASMQPAVRAASVDLLLSRKTSAHALLRAVENKKLSAMMVTLDQVRQVAVFEDANLDAIVRKHWGSVKVATPEEKLAEVRRLNNDLRAASGDRAAGRELFTKTCAICHRFFGEGSDVGPDLTHANRRDRDYLLVSTVDPNAVVRSEYLNYIVQTTDGQTITGLMTEQTPAAVTLKNANDSRTTVERAKIKQIRESPVSLMPEGLLLSLKPQQVRDLFAYLQGEKP